MPMTFRTRAAAAGGCALAIISAISLLQVTGNTTAIAPNHAPTPQESPAGNVVGFAGLESWLHECLKRHGVTKDVKEMSDPEYDRRSLAIGACSKEHRSSQIGSAMKRAQAAGDLQEVASLRALQAENTRALERNVARLASPQLTSPLPEAQPSTSGVAAPDAHALRPEPQAITEHPQYKKALIEYQQCLIGFGFNSATPQEFEERYLAFTGDKPEMAASGLYHLAPEHEAEEAPPRPSAEALARANAADSACADIVAKVKTTLHRQLAHHNPDR